MYSEAHAKASIKYAKNNLKRVPFDLKLSDYERLKGAADRAGEPVNTYIKNAVNMRIEIDSKKAEE